MQEFMLLIRNQKDHQSEFTPEMQEEFVRKCEVYIGNLKKNGNLKAAQPMVKQGKMLSNPNNAWEEGPFNENKEVIVGYYHILARDLEEAIEIAKGNPEFAYTPTARVEVRPLKTVESITGFEYPDKNS